MDTLSYKTIATNKSTANKLWVLIDAEGQTLGRLASKVAILLRGKHKPNFTPHVDCGDNVVVINADKVSLTGKKMNNKIHYWHTGYPGGIKSETYGQILESKKPQKAIELAVKRMIPKGPLGREQLKKLYIYTGENHPHEAQKPQLVDITAMNSKNKRDGK